MDINLVGTIIQVVTIVVVGLSAIAAWDELRVK